MRNNICDSLKNHSSRLYEVSLYYYFGLPEKLVHLAPIIMPIPSRQMRNIVMEL